MPASSAVLSRGCAVLLELGVVARPSGCTAARPRNMKFRKPCWARSGSDGKFDMSVRIVATEAMSGVDMPHQSTAQPANGPCADG